MSGRGAASAAPFLLPDSSATPSSLPRMKGWKWLAEAVVYMVRCVTKSARMPPLPQALRPALATGVWFREQS